MGTVFTGSKTPVILAVLPPGIRRAKLTRSPGGSFILRATAVSLMPLLAKQLDKKWSLHYKVFKVDKRLDVFEIIAHAFPRM
jgi:hypothetical protein